MPIHGARRWRPAARLLAGLPLRVRLAAAACCALCVAACVIGLAASLAARAALTAQADRQLRTYAWLLSSRPFSVLPAGSEPGSAAAEYLVEVVSAGKLVLRTADDQLPGPAMSGLPSRPGRLATVPAGRGGGSWLVLTERVHYSARRIIYTYGSDGFFLNVTSPARPGTAGVLVVALDLGGLRQAADGIMLRSAAVVGGVIVVVVLAVLALIRAVLGPLGLAEQLAAAVARDGPSWQQPGGRPGSIGDSLAQSLTGTLSRLEAASLATDDSRRSCDLMRTALARTCRELHRPISVIRGSAAYYQQQGSPASQDLDQLVDRVGHEAARIGTLLDELAAAAEPSPRRAAAESPGQRARSREGSSAGAGSGSPWYPPT